MGCRSCSKKKIPIVQTFNVRIKGHKAINTLEAREIIRKLEIYAKELIKNSNK